MNIQKRRKSTEESLEIEKEKQRLLNIAIEEIERDLGETFLEKEKFKNMALDVSKMLLYLKKYDSENFMFSTIKLVGVEIPSETCFCENCIMDKDMSEAVSHGTLKLHHCLKWIDRLIHAGCRLEEEVCELKNGEFELKSLYKILKDKNSELEMIVDKCNRNLETTNNQVKNLTWDLSKQKEKCEYLSHLLDEKVTLNMQFEAENNKLLNSIVECDTKLKIWEENVLSLSINQENLELSLSCKDREIASLKTTFDKNVCLLKETQLKCEEYRNEIQLLNGRISEYEKEKEGDQQISQTSENSFVSNDLVKSSKTIINEMQAKIDSLTKDNNLLNLTIENTEKELKNVHMEKQILVEEVENLSKQITSFKQEISVSTQKCYDEKKNNENLMLKLRECEKLVLDNDHTINQLKTKNETLQKNAMLMKSMTKEHEELISKNNSDLKKFHQIIEQLEKRIAALDKENTNLRVQAKEVKKEECLRHKLNELISQKSEMEEEIKRLKLVETEKETIFEKLLESNLQRNNFTEQVSKLTFELETQNKENADLQMKLNELSMSLTNSISSNTSLEKELNKNKNLISNLNRQLEESSNVLKNIKNINCELATEISTFKSIKDHLTQEIETLTKNLQAECNKNEQIMRENNTLKTNGNVQVNVSAELQKLRTTLNGASNFIANVLNIILCAVQSYPESTDFEELRLSLMELMVHWTQNSEKEFKTIVFDQLSSFFGTLINNHKDDLAICELISKIKNFVKDSDTIDGCCQGAETSLVISPDTLFNRSVFGNTFASLRNSCSSSIFADLQYIEAQIKEFILNFNNSISKKTEEIEKLNKELKQLLSTSAKNEAKPTEKDNTSFKWKYEVMKRQNRQLEEKYNKIVISSEQMEKTIKKLEEENKRLEEETEDLCKDLKNMEAYYSSSDELLDALTELNSLRLKLKELENENNSLKEKEPVQEFQLQQKSLKKPSSCSQRQTQIPHFDRTCLKENNHNRSMK